MDISGWSELELFDINPNGVKELHQADRGTELSAGGAEVRRDIEGGGRGGGGPNLLIRHGVAWDSVGKF